VLKVGSVTIKGRVLLAPMSGVSDYPFRHQVALLGAPCVVSEMIASESMIRQTRQSKQMAQTLSSDIKIVGGVAPPVAMTQIAGVKPEVMAEAAKLAVDNGAMIVDINMGCPAKKVVGQAAGSALMRDLKHARSIIGAVVKAVSVPVTLKMRKGWDNESENAPELAKIAEAEGVKMITVHGRTRCQFYSGLSDWAFFRLVKKAVRVPVIGNGDIKTPQEAQKVIQNYGVDGVMIGRGCYGKPWRIHQVDRFLKRGVVPSEPSLLKKRDVMKAHLSHMLDFYGISSGVRIARKHLGWYSKGAIDGANFRSEVNQTESPTLLFRLIDAFFEKQKSHHDTTSHISSYLGDD